ncbi:hypothetical protein F1735_18220 [Massilia sp. CCM 8694]|uniref:Glycine-rich domain-containing protein-like n=2 Tax=Massilia genomosp. 1 TaxID=2609280 RepID=A0ABX0MN86_9BURK|nr:hypothetical protein [Massilia genomosp. 1]
MMTNDAIKAISELDLDPIKFKLTHAESGEGWSQEKADAVEVEYRRFLYLMKAFPEDETAPMIEVDIFWHYHILDTMKYAKDCEHVFGYFLHHYPYVGMSGEEEDTQHLQDCGNRMRDLYESSFGEVYGARAAAWCTRAVEETPLQAGGAQSAWCTRTAEGETAVAAGAKAAWCTRTNAEAAKAAWCTRTTTGSAASAWCTRTVSADTKAAWCTRTTTDSAKSAWCTRTATPEAKAAWCTRTTTDSAKSAWCTRTATPQATSAWCTRTATPQATSAWCTRTATPQATSAWCTRTSAKAVKSAWCTRAMPAAVQSAWCTRVSGEPMVVTAATSDLLLSISKGVAQSA